MNMKKYKLGDLLFEFHAGKAIQTENIKNKGAYPVYGGNGQRGYTNSYNQNGEYLIIGRQGAYCGNVRYNIGKAYLTEHAIVGQAKENHNPIYIALKLSLMNLSQLQGQSAQPGLSVNTLSCISMEMPPKEIQDKIADIMLKLDRKIELNRQINDNLEAMAKQLYDYWFVQFDFPNEEGKPYKSSGGAMVWNEKLKREIPQGLDTPKIGDIEKNIITGKTPSCADEDNFGGDIPFVTIDDIRGNLFVFEAQRTLSTKGADSQEKKYLPIGSLSVSCIGTIGVMGFVARLAQTNQQINSIVFEHEYNKEFLYFSLKLYYENAKAKTGNVFANMSKEEFASIIVAYPPKQILQAFHNKVAPIFDSIKNNIEEINSLTKQRDELLPLLMNSQATVNYHLSDD